MEVLALIGARPDVAVVIIILFVVALLHSIFLAKKKLIFQFSQNKK